MVRYKRRIIAFLLVILLSSTVISVCSGQSATDESPKSLLYKSTSLFSSDPNFSTGSDTGLNTTELFYKMMLAVLLVIALGAAAIYISKKFVPKITSLSGKKVQVCETVHLGPRKAIYLIKVGKQMLLIGSTNESITRLADVTDTLTEADLSPRLRSGQASKEIDSK